MDYMHFFRSRPRGRSAFQAGRFVLYLGVAAVLMHWTMGAALAA